MPLIVLMGVVPLMLLAIVSPSVRAVKIIHQDAQRNMALKAKTLANAVFWWERINALTLSYLSQQPDIISMNAERQKPLLTNLVNAYEYPYLASTIKLDGWNLARSDGNKPVYYGDRTWFLDARAGKDLTYQTLISRTTKKPAACLGKPIFKERLEIVGVAMLCTELEALAEQVGKLQFGKTGYGFVVDRFGRVLAHPNSGFLSGKQLRDLNTYPPVKNILEGRKGYFSFADEQGINWVSYSDRLDNGWGIVILQQKAELLKNEREFDKLGFLVASIAVLGAGAVNWLLANHLTKPIRDLTTARAAFSNAQLDKKVEIKRQDELGVLARSCNQITARLETSFDELERRIEERTTELKKAKETAEVANQAKDRFLTSISHELRTPLNSILGYAKMLQQDRNLMLCQVQGLRVIEQSGTHLLTLIDDILDFSKVKVGKIELHPTDLYWPNFLDGIVSLVQMSAREKNLLFKCEIEGTIATGIRADEKRLGQVLINLLSNAVKFTEQGKVTLRISVIEQVERFSASSLPQQSLRFEIIDTGLGINPEQLEKIFQPFEQAGLPEYRGSGLGLGLAISKQLLELMGSQLNVKSILGKGSTFWFDISLPLVEIFPETQNNRVGQLVSYQRKRHKLLVVDDKEENRSLLVNMLEPWGFEVVTAVNGQQVLEIIPSIQPDLILLDLFMPVKTGFTLVKQLRQITEFKTLPIILISASCSEMVKKATQYLGCEDFLTKPIDEKKLLALLKHYLQLDLASNQKALSS
jgi:signal transduction histidine kinase/ActR/RegA family two-component response regulator